jgi:hypothetical protein
MRHVSKRANLIDFPYGHTPSKAIYAQLNEFLNQHYDDIHMDLYFFHRIT